MRKDFWLERWEKQEIGFHQEDFNPHLRQHWAALQVASNCEVLVPLCGKSMDMIWLRDQGHKVLGVELSEIAVQCFFEENGMKPVKSEKGKFEAWEADGITLLCGDFFDLHENQLEGVRAVYDRAALIALPPEMRGRYADHLTAILKPGTATLLVAFDYPAQEMQGPPFAVSKEDVHALYDGSSDVILLHEYDALADNPRFLKRGLTRLHEYVFRLSLRASRA